MAQLHKWGINGMPLDAAVAHVADDQTRQALMYIRTEFLESAQRANNNLVTLSLKVTEHVTACTEDGKNFEQWKQSIFDILNDTKSMIKQLDKEAHAHRDEMLGLMEKEKLRVDSRFNKWQNVLLGILWSWCGVLTFTVATLIWYIITHGVH